MTQAAEYQPQVLAETAGLTREEWLSYRRRGIGGSDAAAVLGISPFRTAVDLYYDKLGLPTAYDEKENWVALEVGNLLEDLVARIFAKKTGLKVYQRKCMFQHPSHPWMLTDLDYLVDLPDGTTAILEIKTTNYNARDKWKYNGEPIVPPYYESQGRHYMAVMNLDRVYFCCLYGNNEDEVMIRSIDRDRDYESELIALEEDFWESNILARRPPPYIENDGELILNSLQRLRGPSLADAEPAQLAPIEAVRMSRYLELQKEKKKVEDEMNRLKALVLVGMGENSEAVCADAGGSYIVTYRPSKKTSIQKDDLLRLKMVYPDIYEEYVTVTESRKFQVKWAAAEAA